MNLETIKVKEKKKIKIKILQKRVDNKLDIEFPMHNEERNYVQEHGQGYKNRENVDLFAHYFRMYLKNKFKINQIKKERKKMIEEQKKM